MLILRNKRLVRKSDWYHNIRGGRATTATILAEALMGNRKIMRSIIASQTHYLGQPSLIDILTHRSFGRPYKAVFGDGTISWPLAKLDRSASKDDFVKQYPLTDDEMVPPVNYYCGIDTYDETHNCICIVKKAKVGTLDVMEVVDIKTIPAEKMAEVAQEMYDRYGECTVLCDDGRFRKLSDLANNKKK